MKWYSCSALFVLFNFCMFSQTSTESISKLMPNSKINEMVSVNQRNVEKAEKVNQNEYRLIYNKDSTQTTVRYYNMAEFTVAGFWNKIDLRKYNIKYYVSHCPTLINEYGVILEYGIFEQERKKKSSRQALLDNKKYFDSVNTKHEDFKFVRYDTINNFYMHKKKETNTLTNDVTDVFYLRGVKNGKNFYLALFNFNEEDYDGIDKFLEDCYIKNR